MEYFIDSEHGNDNNPGTSTAPWKTFEKMSAVIKEGGLIKIVAKFEILDHPSHSSRWIK